MSSHKEKCCQWVSEHIELDSRGKGTWFTNLGDTQHFFDTYEECEEFLWTKVFDAIADIESDETDQIHELLKGD